MSNNLLKMSDHNQPFKFSRGLGRGTASLCVTGLIIVGRSGFFIVCLDLEVIPVMFVKQKYHLGEWSFGPYKPRE
jgi:hypothetical protein